MQLCAPVVHPPITPLTRKVRVSGALVGATVRLFEDDALVGEGIAGAPVSFIPLNAGVTLTTGRRVTAAQEFGGIDSLPTGPEMSAIVLAMPTAPMLGAVSARVIPLQCSSCLWLDGIVPGTTVAVEIGSSPVISIAADWTAVHVDVPSLTVQDRIRVQQTATGLTGPWVTLVATLKQETGGPVEPPTLETPLFLCQRAVVVNVLPGAKVTLDHDGESQFCFGAAKGTWWLDRGLELHDRITVRQEYLSCELRSGTADYTASEMMPPPPEFLHPVCANDSRVALGALVPGARVQFFAHGDTGPFAAAQAAEDPNWFNITLPAAAPRLGVRQSICDYGPWSDIAWTRVTAPGAPDYPEIVEPVHACGTAVGVRGLSAGTWFRISSQLWGGPFVSGVGSGDERVDVVVPPLQAGDRLNLETIKCGVFRGHGRLTPVLQPPDVLPVPGLADPSDDCGGKIHVRDLVAGAIVEIETVPSPDFPANVVGTVIASHPVTAAAVNVPVPPLAPRTLVRARQRLCRQISRVSDVVQIDDRAIEYVPHSTFRIAQITGEHDPGSRPHLVDTTLNWLWGTDLGIPVAHGGRLYFFFGDSSVGEGDNPVEQDSDPAAWTTDGPEPDGPLLHWLLEPGETHVKRLAVDGLPPLTNYEVPTGGFSYGGRLYLFIARYKTGGKMHTSHLAVTYAPQNDPGQNFKELYKVASTLDEGTNAPAGAWLVHVSPTVVKNADWPGLPASAGDGLLMFGTSLYQESNVFLAWTPLTPGQEPPHPSTWKYFKADHPGRWIAGPTIPQGQTPTPLLNDMPPRGWVAELSVAWEPRLRRWVMAHTKPLPDSQQVVVRTARNPWGPWSAPTVIFDGIDPQQKADARNLTPGERFVHIWRVAEDRPGYTVPYAPYLIPRWSRFDQSAGRLTLYFTLSVEDPPYNTQLLRSVVRCP